GRPPAFNAAQARAVETPPGPLLVLAGAGTGKTRVVIGRIARLVRRGAAADRILAVTFTTKAAREMAARAGRGRNVARPEISTIHSLCARILRRHAPRLGYPARFAILDRGEQETIARRVLKELRVADAVLAPSQLLDRISRWKAGAVRPAAAIETIPADAPDSWTLAAAGYRRYQDALRTAGAVDFDDLLLLVDELLTGHEPVRLAEAGRYDHLLVDEYQDTSAIQERILTALARDHRSLCVVGDDDQSIYAWRGAQVSNILDFPARWPGTLTVRLEENYRSTPQIVRAANQLIGCNSRRHGKTLVSTAADGPDPIILQAQDEIDEARRVVGDLEGRLRAAEMPAHEAAILVRTAEQTRGPEQELRRRGIPYEVVGSRSFFDRREVKDVLAFLRLAVDPDDDLAVARIANVPARGLSGQTIQKARTTATVAGRSLWTELRTARAEVRLSPPAMAGVEQLEQLVASAAGAPPGTMAAWLRGLLDRIDYRRYLLAESGDADEAETRWACVNELADALAAHEQGQPRHADPADSVRRFLDDLLLEVRETERFRESGQKRSQVRLMTLHAAKGLEFDCVWMMGMEEGLLPHHRSLADGLAALDEERRLCYVGVTRARRLLTLSMCLTRMKWGRKRPGRPSRFLYELTGQPEKFVAAPPPDESPPAAAAPASSRGAAAGGTRRDRGASGRATAGPGSRGRRAPRA
ncbi:MAG: ATP-dependent helicase, partial [Pirellulales bacterium]